MWQVLRNWFYLQNLCRKAEYWVLADRRQLECRACELPWTVWDWVCPFFLMNKLKNFEVSTPRRWVLRKWRARAWWRHMLSLYRCPVFSSNVRHLIVPFLNWRSSKTASSQAISRSLSKAAKSGNFVKLCNLYFVYIVSPLQNSMTSILLKMSFSFANSPLVHTSLDRSSMVLFSCA